MPEPKLPADFCNLLNDESDEEVFASVKSPSNKAQTALVGIKPIEIQGNYFSIYLLCRTFFLLGYRAGKKAK
jgi:hypothetical protein